MRKCWNNSGHQSYRIALCGMALAVSSVMMLLGHSLGFGEYFWYFAAALFVDLPEKRMDKGLCCLGSCLLSLILCGFNFIYLASYLLLLAPYPVIKSALEKMQPLPRHLLMSLFWFAGMGAIMWFTPMFWIQLSAVQDNAVRLLSLLALLVLSLVIEPLYARVHGFGKKIILKVMFHLS